MKREKTKMAHKKDGLTIQLGRIRTVIHTRESHSYARADRGGTGNVGRQKLTGGERAFG